MMVTLLEEYAIPRKSDTLPSPTPRIKSTHSSLTNKKKEEEEEEGKKKGGREEGREWRREGGGSAEGGREGERVREGGRAVPQVRLVLTIRFKASSIVESNCKTSRRRY